MHPLMKRKISKFVIKGENKQVHFFLRVSATRKIVVTCKKGEAFLDSRSCLEDSQVYYNKQSPMLMLAIINNFFFFASLLIGSSKR